MPGRVLVTGLSGFTGKHLRLTLEAAGYEVVGLDEQPGFDLRNRSSVVALIERSQPNYVIHLAGISFVPHGDPADIYATNVVGVTYLLEALQQYAPSLRKVILPSSANVYGNTTKDLIDESTPPVPVNHYGCSKLSMEFMARTWFTRLPIVVTRPFNYTGPGQSPQFIVPKLVDHFAQRKSFIELGNVDVVRDFSDVRSVCDAYCRLLDSPIHSTTLNVASGQGRSLRSLLEMLESISQRRLEVKTDQSLVRAVEVVRLIGSNDALRAAIGELRFTDFRSTLQWMYEAAFRDNASGN